MKRILLAAVAALLTLAAPAQNSFYSFTVNDVEYHLHREFECTLGEGRPHEGAITIHYNPDYIHEHYLGDSCYKVESAKDKVLLTILMWTVFLIALVGYIVKSLRSPGDYFD